MRPMLRKIFPPFPLGGLAALAASAALAGCGGSSDSSTATTDAVHGLPAHTSCSEQSVELPKNLNFETIPSNQELTVEQPRSNKKMRVGPLKSSKAESVRWARSGPEPLEATAASGTLLFVEFHFKNIGKTSVSSLDAAELFLAQVGKKTYKQTPACRAGQIYALEHRLPPRNQRVKPGKEGQGVAVYAVPPGAHSFAWIGRLTYRQFKLKVQ
jgi:hypothetical protein